VEREKKICGIVIGFCYRSGSVKVHEREVGTGVYTVTGTVANGVDTVHTMGAVHGIRTVWSGTIHAGVTVYRIRYCS
jgi:hypothetical protein